MRHHAGWATWLGDQDRPATIFGGENFDHAAGCRQPHGDGVFLVFVAKLIDQGRAWRATVCAIADVANRVAARVKAILWNMAQSPFAARIAPFKTRTSLRAYAISPCCYDFISLIQNVLTNLNT